MLTYSEALEKILGIPYGPEPEPVALLKCEGRYLARSVAAPFPMPRYTMSAMDGVALRARDAQSSRMDLGVRFRLVGESRAGRPFAGAVGEGEAIRVSTGAALPPGVDGIIPIERAEVAAETVTVRESALAGRYIRLKGEDIGQGDELLPAGTRIGPAQLAFLSSFNLPTLEVWSRPRVAIIGSGDEVKLHGADLREHEIVGSSFYHLERELNLCGCETRFIGVSPDHPGKFRALLSEAQIWADVIVSTAGVSVGEHDLVSSVLRDANAKILFWRVSVRPGKPMLVATLGGKPFFGLPGNPVSTICNTEIFLKPFLRKAFGIDPPVLPYELLRLSEDTPRDPERLFFVYGQTVNRGGHLAVRPLPRQSSANIANPARADRLIVVEPGRDQAYEGDFVETIPIRAGL